MSYPKLNLIISLINLFTNHAGNRVKTNIVAAFESIQNHTCIKFQRTDLTTLCTSAGQKFPVVFRKVGKRYMYLLYIHICLQ